MNITVYQEIDRMWVAADSSPSLTIDKATMKFQENSQLNFSVDDKIIFCIGKADIIRDIILDFGVSFDRSVQELANITKEYFLDWAKYHPDDLQSGVIEIIVCMNRNGQTTAYCISPGGNFHPMERTVEAGKFSVWSIGEKWEEAVCHTMALHNQGLPLFKIFPAVFQSIACAEIGGTLTVHQIDTSGTCLYLRTPIYHDNKIDYNDRGGVKY
jgi:hypothetical protein